MPNTSHEVLAALGSATAAWNHIPSLKSPKLDSVEPGSLDSYYLLATYCFDLQRKLMYVLKATRPFARDVDPALAGEIRRDNDAINARGLTWKQRARRAERIMLRLERELFASQERLLRTASARTRRARKPKR